MAIRVFQLGFDVNRFQILFVDLAYEEVKKRVGLDGTRKGPAWTPPPVYVEYPKQETPDIWKLYEAYSMVLSSRARAAR